MRKSMRGIVLGTVGELEMHGLGLPGMQSTQDQASVACLPVDVALKFLMRVLDRLWKLDSETQAGLLKVSPSTLKLYRRGKSVPRKREQLERIGDLLRVYAALRVLLPDPEAADTWPTRTNARFSPNPVAYMLSHGTGTVRQYLEAEAV